MQLTSRTSAPTATMKAVSDAAGKSRSWKHFLLGVLLLSNLLYVGIIIARSPDTLRASFRAAESRHDNSPDEADQVQTNSTSPSLLPDLPLNAVKTRRLKCLGWRATASCSRDGDRTPENDRDCTSKVPYGSPGYCEVEDEDTHEKFRVMKRTCAKAKAGSVFQCADAPGFANFRVEARDAVEKALAPGFELPNVNSSQQHPRRGIAMVVYQKLIASAYATIRTLRDVLGCRLPIEIWFRPDEMRKSPEGLEPLKNLSRSDIGEGLTFQEINGPKAVRFNTKIYAIYHSTFDEVLFLDADNVPVRDPTYLFDTPEFVKTGAVFWSDYWHPGNTIFYLNADSLVWQLLDMPFVDMFEQESGQVLVDRRRHAAPLELVKFYGFHEPNYFNRMKLAWGDKDLFRFAWLKLNVPFHMIQTPPSVAGRMFGESFCGMTMVQHDTDGEVLFMHRNQMKLTGEARPNLSDELKESADEYPDPAMWSTLVSFRGKSARSDYVIQAHTDHRFSKERRCFGRQFPDRSSHFYSRAVEDLSFAGIETHLRRFAMEAATQLGISS